MKKFLQITLLSLLLQSVSAQTPVLSSNPGANAVIFLDFDGHVVEGTVWNWATNPIVCGASGLNETQIRQVFNRVAEDYRPFNVNITTDSTLYEAAPAAQRTRVIITITSSWYGTAGGVAFTGSFTWGDDTPCFVFSALHKYNVKNIAEATSHEAGHTLGLYHQSRYDNNCNKLSDYHDGTGSGEIGWAPIMGVGYSRNFTLWNNGPNSLGCTNYQNDLSVITSGTNGFGYRNDDHGSTIGSASTPLLNNGQFSAEGIIEQNTDADYFRFIMPGSGRFQLDAVPYNVGTGNAGSNLDMQVTLFSENNTELSVYNPGTLLNSVADTTLNPGIYFLRVEGKGNAYASEYASLGSYSLQATISDQNSVLPLHKLELKGSRQNGEDQFTWIVEADEAVEQQILEADYDGKGFAAVSTLSAAARSYTQRSEQSAHIRYRLQVVLSDGHRYYSNIITLRDNSLSTRPRIQSNLLRSNTVYVNSPGSYDYIIADAYGKILKSGKISAGTNAIMLQHLPAGMYLLTCKDQHQQQWTDKFIRQ